MPKLGINVDHVATLRQARKEFDPDPIQAAKIAGRSGADTIVCHLREDRRHINDKDVALLRKKLKTKLNLEMSLDPNIINIACKIRPNYAMLVPERREEVTTEGGLDVIKHKTRIKRAIRKLKSKKIIVSLFIDPVKTQIDCTKELGAEIIELHTGAYANAATDTKRSREFKKIERCAAYAKKLGLTVHAGHGLKYQNVRRIAKIKDIDELNIGHSIVSEAVFSGFANAVKKMKRLVK